MGTVTDNPNAISKPGFTPPNLTVSTEEDADTASRTSAASATVLATPAPSPATSPRNGFTKLRPGQSIIRTAASLKSDGLGDCPKPGFSLQAPSSAPLLPESDSK